MMKNDPGEDRAEGRVLGIDYGDRRVGLALSDPMRLAAGPLVTLTRDGEDDLLRALREIIREHEVIRIVVGMPLDMNGTPGRRARVTRSFIDRLRAATGLPIEPWDERLTTVQAERVLIAGDVSRARRREVVDQVAAVILLQAWLDSRRAGDDTP